MSGCRHGKPVANAAGLDFEPMSTGQPPTGNAPGGEKRAGSGQFPAQAEPTAGLAKSADKPASVPPASPEVDSGWDASEPTTSVARKAQGVVPAAPKVPNIPNATGPRPNPQSIAPNSSQARGKFTVGNLLSSAQGAGSTAPKNAQAARPAPDHRRQISAVPQKSVERASAPLPDAGMPMAIRHDTPKGIGAVNIAPAPPLPTEPMVRRDTPKGIGAVNVAPAPPLPTEPMVRRDTPKGIGAVNVAASPAPSIEPAVRHDTPKGIGAVSVTPTLPVEPVAMTDTPKGIGTETAVGTTPIAAPSEVAAAPAAKSSMPKATELVSKAAARRASQTSVSGAPSASFSRPKSARQAVKASPSQAPQAAAEVAPAATSEATRVAAQTPSVNAPATDSVTIASKPPATSQALDDPDAWDVAVDTAPVAMPPVAVAKPSEGSIRTKAASTKKSAKTTSQPASEKKPRTGKSQPSLAVAKSAATSQSKIPQARTDSPESELSGEFFAVTEHEVSHAEQFHETEYVTEDVVDERHLRSIRPEAIARRAKFRVLVWSVFVGLLLLLAAAFARKYHLYNLHNLQKFIHLHKPIHLRKLF